MYAVGDEAMKLIAGDTLIGIKAKLADAEALDEYRYALDLLER